MIIMAAILLVGCAVDSREEVTRREILQSWTEMAGAQVGSPPRGRPSQANSPFGSDYITLRRPTSISARGNDIYLQDAGLRHLFRYENFQQTLAPFATTSSVEAGMSIYVAPGTLVYVTDPAHEQVMHFIWDGMVLFRYAFGADALSEPVAVSRDNIVSISDDFDNTIRIYRRHKAKGNNLVLADKIGGSQIGTGSFKILAVWLQLTTNYT